MSTAKPLILLFNRVMHATAFYETLQKVARTEVVTSKSRDEFFKDLDGKYKDISVIYRTSASGAVRKTFHSLFEANILLLMRLTVRQRLLENSTRNSSSACPAAASSSATMARVTTR